jgi:hypothetical protein
MSCSCGSGKIAVAVVTGAHPYDVPGFHQAFWSMPGVDAYVQHVEDYAADAGGNRASYDVTVFYNMHMDDPAAEDAPWFLKPLPGALEQIAEAGKGLVVLHHAILAFPEWEPWRDVVGIGERIFGYHFDQDLHVDVATQDHPITAGLAGWDIVDEAYTMASAGEGSQILLTVDHPLSMKVVGWARRYGNSPVFCLQLGHDAKAYGNPGFREVLARGVRWAAGR